MKLQFRLRTLMIVVTLLAVPLGYVGWQVNIVREREAMRKWIEQHAGTCFAALPSDSVVEEPSAVRRWLGDEAVSQVGFDGEISEDDIRRIKATFQGVRVVLNLGAYEKSNPPPWEQPSGGK